MNQVIIKYYLALQFFMQFSLQERLFGFFEPGPCEYTCNGNLVYKQTFHPYSNGCGTDNLRMSFAHTEYSDLDLCCDKHDVCYSDCGQEKVICDENFNQCMKNTCEHVFYNQTIYSACTSQSDLMYNLVSSFGCGSYKNAKKEACDCI